MKKQNKAGVANNPNNEPLDLTDFGIKLRDNPMSDDTAQGVSNMIKNIAYHTSKVDNEGNRSFMTAGAIAEVLEQVGYTGNHKGTIGPKLTEIRNHFRLNKPLPTGILSQGEFIELINQRKAEAKETA